MKLKHYGFIPVLLVWSSNFLYGQNGSAKPVTPNASPEAKALLQLIYNLSGNHTLTGQHNFPISGDRNSVFFADYVGKTPVIWSTDFGFAKEGDKDSYKMRAAMVEEAKRQNKAGSLITLCWHAVPPTAHEPITFQPVPGADPGMLASVQGRLTDDQFKEILTPGTALYKNWAAQVDTIAYYLKQLEKAHIAVLWRPYHEMNGSWFWWGNRTGDYSTKALYRQLFERLVNYHKLHNLVWVWSVDRPTKAGMEFNNFYPGDKYLDILALDVYGSDFKKDYYDQLLVLSDGKPITLAEVGSPPSPEVLESQPKWSYWVIWAGMVRNTSKIQYTALVNDPRVLGRDDPPYINAVNPFRAGAGLPLLSLNKPADFSGEWVLDEAKSSFGPMGAGNTAAQLKIIQDGNGISLQKTFVEEWRDNRLTDEKIKFDGSESTSEFMEFPRVSTAGMSANRDTLTVNAKVSFNRGGQTTQMLSTEVWNLQGHGKELCITQTSDSPQGKRKTIVIYNKR